MEPWIARVGFAAPMLGIALAFVAPLRSPDVDPERAPSIALERIGSLGDLPPAERRVVVNLDASGRVSVAGATIPLGRLPTVLASAVRPIGTGADAVSLATAVLRVDRSVPWRACMGIVYACVDPRVRIANMAFAVLPQEGDEEGAIGFDLPRDRGCSPDPNAPVRTTTRVRIDEGGIPVDPASLVTEIAQAGPDVRASPPELRIADDVPIGYVLRVMDALHRAGARGITFFANPPPKPGSFADDVRRRANRPGEWGISLDKRIVADPPGGPRPLPVLARVRGAAVGFFEDAPEREETEVIPNEAVKSNR